MKKHARPAGSEDLGFGFYLFPTRDGFGLARPTSGYVSSFPTKAAAEERGRYEVQAYLSSVRRQALADAVATCERRIAEERGAVAYLKARGIAGSDLVFAVSELAHQEALLERLKRRQAESA